MGGSTLPGGNSPLPTADSRAKLTSDSSSVGQPVQEARSDVAKQLRIKKRIVEGEGVCVRVVTDEAETLANVTLHSERIEVEHVLIGRIVDRAPAVREKDGVTIVPIMEEVVVTETRLMLKEELHIRRVVDTREHQQTVLLRRQRAEVEQLPATGKPLSATSIPTHIEDTQP